MNRKTLFGAGAGLALAALAIGVLRPTVTEATPPSHVMPNAPVTAPEATIAMTARLSHRYVGLGKSDLFVTVDLDGVDPSARSGHAQRGSTRLPINLALVIDRSGSRSELNLSLAKQAARELVMQLTPSDRLAIVLSAGRVESLDGAFGTAANKERMLRFIDGIWNEGGTNLGAGLTAGHDLLIASRGDFNVNRLILISEGKPTESILDSNGLLVITREIRSHGIAVTAIGLGTDFDEDLLENVAQTGGGSYAYLQDESQLASFFQKELSRAATQIAQGVRLRFNPPAGTLLMLEVFGRPSAMFNNGCPCLVDLPDFSAGGSERVVVHTTVSGQTPGAPIDIMQMHLEYFDLLKRQRAGADAKLVAMTTAQADVVWANRDQEATVFAARAQSASNMQAAADALKKGDRARALELVHENAHFFEDAAKVAGERAVAQDEANLRHWADAFSGARSDDQVQEASKGAKRKARLDCGLRTSTY